MLFASEQAKRLYDGLTDSEKEAIRIHPPALKDYQPSLSSEANVLTSDSSERPLAKINDHGLSGHYPKMVDDPSQLHQLLAELNNRSSSTAVLLKQRVEGRLKWLANNAALADYPPESAEPELQSQASRPYIARNIQSLEDLYWRSYTCPEVLSGLYDELEHRNTTKSTQLRERVYNRLQTLKGVATENQRSKASASSSVSGPVDNIEPPKPARLYIDKTVAQLKILHLQSDSGLKVQQLLLTELAFRSTPSAKRLKELVEHKLDQLQSHSKAVPEAEAAKPEAGLISAKVQSTSEQQAKETLQDIRQNPAGQTLKHKILIRMDKSGESAEWSASTLLQYVEDRYRVEQKKKEDAARLSLYKKRVLAGQEPTPSQLAVFNSLDDTARDAFLAKIKQEKQAKAIADIQPEVPNDITEPPKETTTIEVPTQPETQPKSAMAGLLKKVGDVFERAIKGTITKEPTAKLESANDTSQQTTPTADKNVETKERLLEPAYQSTERVADFTKPYAKVQAQIQKTLSRQDFRLLLMLSVQERKLSEIGNELELSRRDVKKRAKELIEDISQQYAAPLKAFAEPMEHILDEQEDDVLLGDAAERLGLTVARMRFLVTVAEPHFKQPCRVHQDRVYRPVQLLD